MVDLTKDRIMSLFKSNTTQGQSKSTHVTNGHGEVKIPTKLKIQKQSENKIVTNIRNVFKLVKVREAIKNRIIKDIRKMF